MVAGRRDCAQAAVGVAARGTRDAPLAGGPRPWGAPQPAAPRARRGSGDARGSGREKRDDPDGAMAGRACDRIDFENVPQEVRP